MLNPDYPELNFAVYTDYPDNKLQTRVTSLEVFEDGREFNFIVIICVSFYGGKKVRDLTNICRESFIFS